jgi:adenylate cyclase
VAGEAAGGEVLLIEATRNAAGTVAGVHFHERGKRVLRNVREPVVLHAAVREGAQTNEGLPIDPVCRMAVDPEKAPGRLVYQGVELHFCSLDCARKFLAEDATRTLTNGEHPGTSWVGIGLSIASIVVMPA